MSIPILSVAQMREWEAATWKSGQTEAAVIARVGKVIARWLQEHFPEGSRILVITGKGNNGNDARQACPQLGDFEVELLDVKDPAKQLAQLQQSLNQQPAVVIDALFGIGLNRPLNQSWRKFVACINESSSFVLSIDCPSGLNCDTGLPEGSAVRASTTLTMGAPKRGLLLEAAWPYVGRLDVAPDIGLCPCPVTEELNWTLPEDFQSFFPARPAACHKGDFGHLVVFAGSSGYHGAAVLAARAAQSAHPGLITVVTTKEAHGPVAAQLQSVMVQVWNSKWKLPSRTTAVLFGPGMADKSVPAAMRKQAVSLWQKAAMPVIVDASGLDWLPARNRKAPGIRAVTPHPGEAARLLREPTAAVQADRPGAVRQLSKKLGSALVVLKGHQSLIGEEDGPLFYNSSGNPWLAQGGSGDVLAGYLGGLLAQPMLQNDPMNTVRFAVWRHGSASEEYGWSGWIEELPKMLAWPVEIVP